MFYSLGINHYGVDKKKLINENTYGNLHAEMDAMNKLPINKKNKMIKINVFVFRISRSKKKNLMLARCCDNCYKGIYSIAKQKNYKIKNIFFTNENGCVEKYI
tara:strand:- start:2632 stop:2940 length:309 start_codon:yes stop_codon:yes gene_type:complete